MGLWSSAGRALTEARDISAFVQLSAARDVSRVLGLLHRVKGEAEVDAGKEMRAREGARLTQTEDRTMERSVRATGPGRPSRGAEPALVDEITPPTIPVLSEPPLHLVFDDRDGSMSPPLIQRVRLRTARRPGQRSPVTGAEVGAVCMPAAASGTPMTYLHNGRQYVVVAISGGGFPGELIAFRLPG